MKTKSLEPVWVELIPEELEEGKLYISVKFGTAIHKCCCGCGEEVVTPLSPADWRIIRTGQAVTLHPSIGNWNYPCRSHYFIRNNRVVWAGQMTPRQIKLNQLADTKLKDKYISKLNSHHMNSKNRQQTTPADSESVSSLIKAIWRHIMSFLKH